MRTVAAAWVFFLLLCSVNVSAESLSFRHKGATLHTTHLSTEIDPTYSKLAVVGGKHMRLVHSPVGTENVIVTLNSEGDLIAFDVNERKALWRLSLLFSDAAVYSSGLIYSAGIVVCAVNNLIYGIDLGAGEIKWKGTLESFLSGGLVSLNEGESVAALTTGNYLYVFDVKTGGLIWHHEEMGADVRVRGSRTVAYDPVKHHVVLLLSDGRVSCFDSYSGDRVWDQVLGGEKSDLVGKINTSPVVAAGQIFVIDSAGALVSMDASSGNVVWKGEETGAYDIAAVGDVVLYYTVSRNGRTVAAIDAVTKEQRWALSLNEWSRRGRNKGGWSTLVVSRGKLWVMGGGGYLLGINVVSGIPEEIYTSSLFLDCAHSPVAMGSSLYVSAGRKGLMIVS
ncbi:PQQ-binding-like beta-propeller repeat protein [Anaplasma bovis]|uniref:PQQ-binding-like beta-propeller repeat protein n=1 Tax=Anaplasma bovis TaxID=186733 RepID=UPI002FEE720E